MNPCLFLLVHPSPSVPLLAPTCPYLHQPALRRCSKTPSLHHLTSKKMFRLPLCSSQVYIYISLNFRSGYATSGLSGNCSPRPHNCSSATFRQLLPKATQLLRPHNCSPRLPKAYPRPHNCFPKSHKLLPKGTQLLLTEGHRTASQGHTTASQKTV